MNYKVNPVSIYLLNLYEHYIFLQCIHTFFIATQFEPLLTKLTLHVLLEILQKQVTKTIAKTPFLTDPIFKIWVI